MIIATNNLHWCRTHTRSQDECNKMTTILEDHCNSPNNTCLNSCDLAPLQKCMLSVFPSKLAVTGSVFDSPEKYLLLRLPGNRNQRYNGPFDYNSITNWLFGISRSQM